MATAASSVAVPSRSRIRLILSVHNQYRSGAYSVGRRVRLRAGAISVITAVIGPNRRCERLKKVSVGTELDIVRAGLPDVIPTSTVRTRTKCNCGTTAIPAQIRWHPVGTQRPTCRAAEAAHRWVNTRHRIHSNLVVSMVSPRHRTLKPSGCLSTLRAPFDGIRG
jgi:hypothetical protein